MLLLSAAPLQTECPLPELPWWQLGNHKLENATGLANNAHIAFCLVSLNTLICVASQGLQTALFSSALLFLAKKCTLWVSVFNDTHKERSKKESKVFHRWEVNKWCFPAGKVLASGSGDFKSHPCPNMHFLPWDSDDCLNFLFFAFSFCKRAIIFLLSSRAGWEAYLEEIRSNIKKHSVKSAEQKYPKCHVLYNVCSQVESLSFYSCITIILHRHHFCCSKNLWERSKERTFSHDTNKSPHP